MRKTLKGCLILTLLLLLSIGAVSASEVSDDTGATDVTNTVEPITKEVTSIQTEIENDNSKIKTTGNSIEQSTTTNKTLNKKTSTVTKKETQNIILNSNNFDEYVTDGKFNEKVSDGDTIDIQGKLDDPKFAINVNKPVNIISSTGDAYIDLDTISIGTGGDYKNGIFQITSGSTGTNITGITFHNTRVTIKSTNDVHVDNITVLCEKNTGSGVGSFSIRGNSENITVTNSYFKTIHNGGHSNVVVAGASNCLFENNTVEAWGTEGNVGNTFYLTTYGGSSNTNITIRNNTIRSIMPSAGICWGLVLEGKGHIIENNYINASAAVVAQYADAEYGVVTEIDGIIFRNNYVAYGGPHLTFPGEAYNNTINGPVTLGNIKAYNNTFENVTINNNVLFENNTAKKVVVNGENNTLNNNEVYSTEEYAIIINGENNTVSNNMLCSNNGIGDSAISNSTEVILLNNGGTPLGKIYYLNENNMGEYFTDISSMIGMPGYAFNPGVFNSGDILVFNLNNKDMPLFLYEMSPNSATGIIIENTTDLNLVPMMSSSITLRNSYSAMAVQDSTILITLINSTISRAEKVQKDDNSYVLYEYPKDNTYVLTSITQNVFDNNGNILTSVNEGADVLFYEFNDKYEPFVTMMGSSVYLNEIYVNKPLNFRAMGEIANIQSNIHFMDGSRGSNITGALFTGNVVFESENINFINCTFNNDLVVNQSVIYFDGCTFNGKVVLNSSNFNIFNNNIFNSADSINVVSSRINTFENNTVNTTGEYAIVFDDDSNNNIVRYNNLVAGSSFGDYSVVGGDNIVEDNTPSYSTQIIIGCESQYFADETPEITISVNDIDNNMLVTSGYVEVYYDAYFIDKKNLVNGQTTVTLPPYTTGNYPIKVWYYNGLKYNNNVTKVNIDVVKSNVTISVDEFTAKMNEKATTDITFLNQKGNPVQDTNITITVGRTTYTIETVNGVASLSEVVTTEWLDAGKMIITFPDTSMYNRNSTTVTLNTSKADVKVIPEVSVEASTASIKLTYTDDLENSVNDGKVYITTLDGTQLANGRVTDGVYTASVTLPEGYSEEYLVSNYTGSYYYNDLVRNIKLTAMLNSTITLETNSPVYGEELIINGRLTDSNGNPIKDTNITVNINGVKEIISTDGNGNYTYSLVPGLGLNTIVVSFDGNIDVYGSRAAKNITIRDTDHDMNEVLNQLDEITAENARLQEQLDSLTDTIGSLTNNVNSLTDLIGALTDLINKQNEQIANQSAVISDTNDKLDNLTQANEELSQQLIDTTNNLTAQNDELKEQVANQTETINDLNDKVDNLTQANENLSQQLTDTTNNLSEQIANQSAVIDELNNKVDNLTIANEDLSQQLMDTTNNLTAQNDELKEQVSNQTETINDLNDKIGNLTQANEDLSQQLTDTTNNLTAQNDELKEQVANLTQANEDLSQQLADTTDNLTAQNDELKEQVANQTETINDLNDKIDNLTQANEDLSQKVDQQSELIANLTAPEKTSLVFDPVVDARYNDKIVISGILSTEKGSSLSGQTVTLTIGDKTVDVVTKNGVFEYASVFKSLGEQTVTASYAGNDNYIASDATLSFDVGKQDVIVTYESIQDTARGDNVTITGKFTNVNGKAITNSNVKILINGKKYYAKTDKNGVYTLSVKVTTVGLNNVTVGYSGNDYYNSYETNTTFNADKQNVIVTYDPISDVTVGGNVTITGKFTDNTGKAITNSNVKIMINGKKYYAKTDKTGAYTFTTQVKTLGINNVTVGYSGNANYNSYETTTTFNVIAKEE